MESTAEHQRLLAHRDRRANWKRWGPYLAERAWGTVREDYSPDGEAWSYFPHAHARSRAYRWNEDGLAGYCDRKQYLCLALALWNGVDPILKERMYGLNGNEGNHGEDVKEYYYFVDGVPSHAYMKMLYKYPQSVFPYQDLVEENQRRSTLDPEYDLIDTGIFDDDRYFDVFVEYAKADTEDVLMRIRAFNRGPDAAPLWLLPTAWFRNTWSWGYERGPMGDVRRRPVASEVEMGSTMRTARLDHAGLGTYRLYCKGAERLLFTENETHNARLFDGDNASPYVKDAFHRWLINGEADAIHPEQRGTKVAALYHVEIPAGDHVEIQLRLRHEATEQPFADFDAVFAERVADCDAFYEVIQSSELDAEQKNVQRQAYAGMLWTKQLYYYDVEQWLKGDPIHPAPPARLEGRNAAWRHLVNFDIISMPDSWEYPWYATWDLAFHCVPLADLDVDFAKRQLELFTREWYIHPNGQLPAYEWSFDDVNPPVHAWAAWRVYKRERALRGKGDLSFLQGIFHKLLLNFTWWVNRKDHNDSNIFQGGFLGLDNIGVFDRSHALPPGAHIDQSDGTSWMAAYSLQMMKMALELSREIPIYQDMATKFFEHFLRVAHAMTDVGGDGLWDEEDGFFYDHLHVEGRVEKLKTRSLVGLLPLIATAVLESWQLEAFPTFLRRMQWFVANRPHLAGNMASVEVEGDQSRRLISLLTRERLERLLHRMLDEEEFLSPYGIRSLSKHHLHHPYELHLRDQVHSIGYEPAESQGFMFGGNSNWRGPIWFPINFLIVEALRRFYRFYGDTLKVECPTGSGNLMNLMEVAHEIKRRLIRVFLPDAHGQRPVYGAQSIFQDHPHWRHFLLFHEYYHADTGAGLGAQHQTGWTGLVATLLEHGG